jgi:hypothetical protein
VFDVIGWEGVRLSRGRSEEGRRGGERKAKTRKEGVRMRKKDKEEQRNEFAP